MFAVALEAERDHWRNAHALVAAEVRTLTDDTEGVQRKILVFGMCGAALALAGTGPRVAERQAVARGDGGQSSCWGSRRRAAD